MCKVNKEDYTLGSSLVSSGDEIIGFVSEVGERFSTIFNNCRYNFRIEDFVKVDIYEIKNYWVICRVVNIRGNSIIVDNKGVLQLYKGGLTFLENVKYCGNQENLCRGYRCRFLSQSEFEFLDR